MAKCREMSSHLATLQSIKYQVSYSKYFLSLEQTGDYRYHKAVWWPLCCFEPLMSSVIFQDKKTVFVVPMDLGSNQVIRNFFISCKMLKDETKTKEEGNSLSQTFLLPIFISNETECLKTKNCQQQQRTAKFVAQICRRCSKKLSFFIFL